MKFIDVNCMVGEWGWKKLRFKTAEELIAEMDRLGIEKSMVFDSRAWLYDPNTGNRLIVDASRGKNRLIPVIVLTSLIDQEFGGKECIMEFMKENGIGAVRLFPADHNYTLKSWNIDKLFSLLDEARIPVLLEGRGMDGGIECYYSYLYEVASTYKNTPIILLTISYRGLRILYSLMEKCPNIYIDTSTFIPFRGIEDLVNHLGSGRIVFGSRMPFIEAGLSVGRIIYADICDEDKENIAYKNIAGILAGNRVYNAALMEVGGQ